MTPPSSAARSTPSIADVCRDGDLRPQSPPSPFAPVAGREHERRRARLSDVRTRQRPPSACRRCVPAWIAARGHSRKHAGRRRRLEDDGSHRRTPRRSASRAWRGERRDPVRPRSRTVTQLHCTGGARSPREMRFVALRENRDPSSSGSVSRRRPGDHPGQCQPSRNPSRWIIGRAFPQGQRQHRQLRGDGSIAEVEDDLGRPGWGW